MKIWLLILYGLIAAAVIIAVCYWMDWLNIRPFVDGAWTAISSGLANLNIPGINLSQIISENIMGIVGLGVGAVGILIQQSRVNSQVKQNQELLESQKQLVADNLDLNTNVKSLTTIAGNQASELEMYAKDTTAQTLQGRINELQSTLQVQQSTWDDERTRLQKELQEAREKLEHRPVEIVERYK